MGKKKPQQEAGAEASTEETRDDEIEGGEDPELADEENEDEKGDGPRSNPFAGTGHTAPNGQYIPSQKKYEFAGYSPESYPEFATNRANEAPRPDFKAPAG